MWLHTLAATVLILTTLVSGERAWAQDAPLVVEEPTQAIECLTLAVAYEAGYESLEGQQAVAEVVLNRVRDPRFPKTVCGVVFAGSNRRTGCQFTFTCDGSLLKRRLPALVLESARRVAEDSLAGRTPLRAPGATHYHADYVYPYWAPGLVRVTKIGAHIFYHPHGSEVAGVRGTRTEFRSAVSPVASPATQPPSFTPWGLGIPEQQ